jgi:hypothetical protein
MKKNYGSVNGKSAAKFSKKMMLDMQLECAYKNEEEFDKN